MLLLTIHRVLSRLSAIAFSIGERSSQCSLILAFSSFENTQVTEKKHNGLFFVQKTHRTNPYPNPASSHKILPFL